MVEVLISPYVMYGCKLWTVGKQEREKRDVYEEKSSANSVDCTNDHCFRVTKKLSQQEALVAKQNI